MKDLIRAPVVVSLGLGFSFMTCVAVYAQRAANPAAQTQPQVSATPARTVHANGASASSLAGLEGKRLSFDEMLANLPRRVASKAGTPGDMVNLLIIGSKEQVASAFQAAGWVAPDKSTEDAIVHVIQETVNHQAYSEMPMSRLYLFGRSQDFGFTEGMPIQIVAERNHFRLWRAPWLGPDGRTVWAGAGTHDIGIEKDSAGQLTHRIDPNVDSEREYILQSLRDTGKVEKSQYLTLSNPVRQALTATGDTYHSDGRILVIYLK